MCVPRPYVFIYHGVNVLLQFFFKELITISNQTLLMQLVCLKSHLFYVFISCDNFVYHTGIEPVAP